MQGYFSGAASAVPPMSIALGRPLTYHDDYNFIVDATARNYTVNVTVTGSSLQEGGKCAITFQSERPTTASLAVALKGNQWFFTDGTTANVKMSDPIFLTANVTTASFAGNFMFMQIANTIRTSKIDSNSIATHQSNDHTNPPPGANVNGPIIDNFKTGSPESTGYPYGSPTPPYSYGWTLNAGQTMKPSIDMSDAPGYSVSIRSKQLKDTISFSTYLMFTPDVQVWGGVWIALAQVDWIFDMSGTKVSGVWPADYSIPQANPVVKPAPSGGKEFPLWVNTAKNYLDTTKNPFIPGF